MLVLPPRLYPTYQSPRAHHTKKHTVESLSDSVLNKVTVKLSNGSTIRIALSLRPKSRLLSDCFRAIASVTPFASSCAILGDFLDWKHAFLGPVDQSEWTLFVHFVLHQISSTNEDIKQSDFSDWDYVLSGHLDQRTYGAIFGCLDSSACTSRPSTLGIPTPSASKQLTTHLATVVYALHLVYENYKLNILTWEFLPSLASLLMPLTARLGWLSFVDHYSRDFGNLVSPVGAVYNASEPAVPIISRWLLQCLSSEQVPPFPLVNDPKSPCSETRRMCRLYATLGSRDEQPFLPPKHLPSTWLCGPQEQRSSVPCNTMGGEVFQRVVLAMTDEGIKLEELDCIPFGVALPLHEAIRLCRVNPPSNWPQASYTLVSREGTCTIVWFTVQTLHHKCQEVCC